MPSNPNLVDVVVGDPDLLDTDDGFTIPFSMSSPWSYSAIGVVASAVTESDDVRIPARLVLVVGLHVEEVVVEVVAVVDEDGNDDGLLTTVNVLLAQLG